MDTQGLVLCEAKTERSEPRVAWAKGIAQIILQTKKTNQRASPQTLITFTFMILDLIKLNSSSYIKK